MDTNIVMVEAVVRNEYVDDIYAALDTDPKALSPQVAPHDHPDMTSIVVGFKNRNDRNAVVGKIEKVFPGKVSWR